MFSFLLIDIFVYNCIVLINDNNRVEFFMILIRF